MNANELWKKCQETLDEILEARAESKEKANRNGRAYLQLGMCPDGKFSLTISNLALYNQHETLGFHDTIEDALEQALDFIKKELLQKQIEIEERKNNTVNRLKALQ
jgi:hypothetical protein